MMIALDVLISSARELDPLPQIVTRLATLIADGEWELDELVEIVELDPALTVRTLRVANSAASGSCEEITSVETAVMRVGPGIIPALALGAAVRDGFSKALPAYGLAEGELWRHLVAAALATERLGARGVRVPHECFAAALLHDVGKLVLAKHLDPELASLIERERLAGRSQLEAEARVLEVDHSELGALVVAQWELPDCFAHAIRRHHEPWEAPPVRDTTSCYVMRAADLISHTVLDAEQGVEAPQGAGLEPAVLAHLGLTVDDVEALRGEVAERLDDVLTWYR